MALMKEFVQNAYILQKHLQILCLCVRCGDFQSNLTSKFPFGEYNKFVAVTKSLHFGKYFKRSVDINDRDIQPCCVNQFILKIYDFANS